MTDKKAKEEQPKFLALLLFIGAAGLLLAYFNSSDSMTGKPGSSSMARSQKYENNVNKHLMNTNERMAMQRKRVEVENANTIMQSQNRQGVQTPYVADGKLDLSSEDHAAEMAKQLGRGARQEDFSSPEEVVQKELFDAQQAAEYTQAYKEAYAKQFVENARRGGYKVILSEDLSRVISVKQIRGNQPNSMEVFGSGQSPVQ
jgi:flagellar motor protein MotB